MPSTLTLLTSAVHVTIITFLYLIETEETRKLIQEDFYRRSLPVMLVVSPTNKKDKEKTMTEIDIENNGATAFNELISIFWVDGDNLILDDTPVVKIGDATIPFYRYKYNQVTGSSRTLTLNLSRVIGKIKNLNDFYLLIILKYSIPLSDKCKFERYSFKYVRNGDISQWNFVPISKVEGLCKKAKGCINLSSPNCLTLSLLFPELLPTETFQEVEDFWKDFFTENCSGI